jgi:parallel beta-helix repeat protein
VAQEYEGAFAAEGAGFVNSAEVSICAALVVGVALVSTPTPAWAKSVTVHPGESIQAAVDAASPNDTVKVLPGDYTETNAGPAAVRVTKPLKLIAKSKLPDEKVRILPGPGQSHGIVAEPANEGDPDINGLTIQGFTIEGFPNMGIWLRHVDKFTIEGNESINNLENGIFPTLSANGLVKRNVAYGSQDAALWVEGSENVRVIDNELSTSPTGLEVTISKDVTVQKNNIHDNTIGIGLYHPATAGLPQAEWPNFEFGNWHIINNQVHHNNVPNSASEGSETSQLPYGGGILLLGVQNVDVQKNLIERNDFFGIAMVDYCLVTLGTPFNCTDNPPPTVTPTAPDHDQVIKNKLVDNHAFPPAGPYQSLAADILEVGGGPDNCFSKNTIDNASALAPPLTNPDPLAPVCK